MLMRMYGRIEAFFAEKAGKLISSEDGVGVVEVYFQSSQYDLKRYGGRNETRAFVAKDNKKKMQIQHYDLSDADVGFSHGAYLYFDRIRPGKRHECPLTQYYLYGCRFLLC